MYQYHADEVFHETVCRTCANEMETAQNDEVIRWVAARWLSEQVVD